MRFSRALASLALLMFCTAVDLVAAPNTAEAALFCPRGEKRVPKWGCVRKSEIAKATRTCANLKRPASFTKCLCEDGKVVGACGD